MLLDLIHEPLLNRDQAKAQLREFFGERLDQDELVSVLSYTGRINMESPFTNDHEALSAAVDAAYGRRRVAQSDPQRRVGRLMRRLELCKFEDQEGIPTCIQQVSGSHQQEADLAEQEYLGVLLGAVEFAAGLSGRKSLVVLGQGVSLSSALELNAAVAAVFDYPYTGVRGGYDYAFDRVILTALERGVVLHFVSTPPSNSGMLGAGAVGRAAIEADPMDLAHRGASEAMTHIARETGGSHHTTDEVGEGLHGVVSLERSGYVLGYYLDRDKKRDNKLHRVKIKCTRSGVEINAPRGYRVESELNAAVNLTLRMSKPGDGPGDGTYRIPFQVEADPEEVGYEMNRGSAAASFVLETAIFDSGGRLLTRTFNIISHAYDGEQWRSGDVEPLLVNGWVEVPPGEYEIRTALRNYKNKNEGEIARRFTLK